jgi:hypothetical protein
VEEAGMMGQNRFDSYKAHQLVSQESLAKTLGARMSVSGFRSRTAASRIN